MSSLFGAALAAPAETCMSLQACCLTGPQSQSFEEVRIADYLASYRSTGRPPPPCPPYPPDPAARAAQGLPPLFVPAPFPGTAGPSTSAAGAASIFGPGSTLGGSAAGTSASAITDPARLPLPQTFVAPVPVGTGSEPESFTSIAAAPEYAHWSHEELRFHAYLRGMRAAPPGAPAFVLAPVPVAPAPAFPGASALPVPDAGDTFMTITTRPEFAGHSVEELRLAWLRNGAELTSAQIFANSGGGPSSQPAAPSNPLLAPPTTPSMFGAPAPAQPTSIFGAPAQPVFGAQPPQPVPVFGAVQAQAQPQPQPLFGAPQPAAQPQGIFGATRPPAQPQQQQWGTQPAAGGAAGGGFSFGGSATPAAAPAPGAFSFGGAGTPAAPGGVGGGGFSFGATPAAGGGGGVGTGFAFGGRRGF
ncbi:hypothetical protein K438DRAFT_2025827 [Mycena galopus ATCC 62051]|nr:hypothetical protein K438DRAFT_2025827 [Mycena galopus ATCC 62051]